MKTFILIIISLFVPFIFIFAQSTNISQPKHCNVLLTTSDGKKFISKDKGYSWKNFDNKKIIIKLKKSNGNEYLSFDNGYSWKNLKINNNFLKKNESITVIKEDKSGKYAKEIIKFLESL